MANQLSSNFARKLLQSFLKPFLSNRVVTKTINTSLFKGRFSPKSGDKYDIKRMHDYTSIETPGGDISGDTKDDIISGKATMTVQNMITQAVEWEIIEEALELNQLDEVIAPMATRSITTLESNLAVFMMQNAGLVHGTPGTAITEWQDVANTGALMRTIGVPNDMAWFYLMGAFSQVSLSEQQSTVIAGPDGLIRTAWENAQIAQNFGGMRALTADALASYTNPTIADRAGTLDSPPDPTYVTSKDTHQQTLTVSGLSAVTIVAGTVLEVPTRFLLNQSTRLPALDASGAGIPWRGVVVADVTLTGTADDIVVSSPAIFETLGSPTRNGAYNTVVAPLTTSDVVNIISGGGAVTEQPNLFYHPQAFSVETVRIPTLSSLDGGFVEKDGFSIRVTRYADGDTNTQKVRFDLLPAFAALTPWFAGHGWK